VSKIRIPVHGNALKSVVIPKTAAAGAQVGVNLLAPDGSVVKWSDILNPPTSTNSGSFNGTSDDVPEGQFNLYFTARRAQDAVGSIVANSSNVTLAYVGGTSLTADLTNVTVTTGGTLRKWAFDSKGRLMASNTATTDDLTEGTTNLYFTKPRVASAIVAGAGISLSTDGSGVTTIAESALILPNLTDQTGNNLTDQSLVQLTGNSTNAISPLLPYTLATLPSAATYKYGTIFVTDLTGAPAPCYSDGTNWRRFSDNSIAS
jgi:hypothetical protein